MSTQQTFGGDFEAVLASARTGDPSALERIYSDLSPAVAGLLHSHGAAEPDDLTSEVFVGVLRNLDGFEGDEASFRSWVFTIAYRRLADERRRRGRQPRVEPLAERPHPVAPVDIEADVHRLLATERVRDLCAHLAPRQRDVIVLRLFAHLTIDEIAAALGKSPGAIKALQRRGYAAIARLIEREGVTP